MRDLQRAGQFGGLNEARPAHCKTRPPLCSLSAKVVLSLRPAFGSLAQLAPEGRWSSQPNATVLVPARSKVRHSVHFRGPCRKRNLKHVSAIGSHKRSFLRSHRENAGLYSEARMAGNLKIHSRIESSLLTDFEKPQESPPRKAAPVLNPTSLPCIKFRFLQRPIFEPCRKFFRIRPGNAHHFFSRKTRFQS